MPCPACVDDRGEPTGEMLVQLPSGTWVRRQCECCLGLRRVDRDGLDRYRSAADARPEPRGEVEGPPLGKGAITTARPPYDPSAFARESDEKIRAVTEAAASISRREAMPPADSVPEMQQVETVSGAGEVLGSDAVPVLTVSREALARLDLPAGAKALLALVNGISSLEAIAARASLSMDEGASLLLELAERGVIDFR